MNAISLPETNRRKFSLIQPCFQSVHLKHIFFNYKLEIIVHFHNAISIPFLNGHGVRCSMTVFVTLQFWFGAVSDL